MTFRQSARQRLGLEAILAWKRALEKSRTSVAERFVQHVKGLQKTLICHLQAIHAFCSTGHAVIQWVARDAVWIYRRFHMQVSLKATPLQGKASIFWTER